MTTVAIVGPDGAGKSAVARRVASSLPIPARALYMGVNLEASGTVLPTTRLALVLKRARGGRPDLTGADGAADGRGAPRTRRNGHVGRTLLGGLRSAARLALWMAEEWYRQIVAWRLIRSGFVVVFDRHFFADYFHTDVRRVPGRSVARRLHGLMLEHLYPRPDAIVVLDVPGDVLESRKGEGTTDWLERRRAEYLELRPHVRSFFVVDANRPLDTVVADVRSIVLELARTDAAPSGPDELGRPTPAVTGGAPR